MRMLELFEGDGNERIEIAKGKYEFTTIGDMMKKGIKIKREESWHKRI